MKNTVNGTKRSLRSTKAAPKGKQTTTSEKCTKPGRSTAVINHYFLGVGYATTAVIKRNGLGYAVYNALTSINIGLKPGSELGDVEIDYKFPETRLVFANVEAVDYQIKLLKQLKKAMKNGK